MPESATPPADLRSHFAIDDVAAAVTIQAGAVVSKVVYRDEIVNVTVFGLDAGEELTEHRAARPAVVQVLAGRMHFNANGEEFDAEPGFWLYMPPGTPHSLVAVEPTVMLLTLLKPDGRS
jgi:quercetin dioxygenase-like cupin family protein